MASIKILNNLTTKKLFQHALLRTNKATITVRNSSNTDPDWVPKDPKTHTGQQWEADDYRLARFVDRPKQVNEEFAIDLIAKVPPKPCKERVVWCDGGDDHTGHPRVFINLDKPGNHSCGYCGLRYYLDHKH